MRFFPHHAASSPCAVCIDFPRCCYSLMHLRNRITYPTTLDLGENYQPNECIECAELNYRPNVCVIWWSFFFWYVRSSLWHFLRPRNEIFNCIMHENSLRKQSICIWWQRSGLPTLPPTYATYYVQLLCVFTVATAENALLFKSIYIYMRVASISIHIPTYMGNGSDCVRHVVDVNGLKSTTIIRKLVEYYNRAWYGRLYRF